MTERHRVTPPAGKARFAVASLIVAGGALALAAQAGADPAEPIPAPAPPEPAAAAPVPGPLVVNTAEGPVAPPPPAPAGPPLVPEIANPVYGQGQTPGQFGLLRDFWRAARSGNAIDAFVSPQQSSLAPPPGAGPAPPLPPGFISLTAPESTTGPAQTQQSNAAPDPAGPPLPPGYFPLSGPPPPDWYDSPPPDPAGSPVVTPVSPAQ